MLTDPFMSESGDIKSVNFIATNDLLADLFRRNWVARRSRPLKKAGMSILPSSMTASVFVPAGIK